jgi:formylglycine-generating enzyme required for sulfatase activity
VLLTPGYAPIEQYHARGRQGPWTDVYGMAGTLYTLLTGLGPPDANGRLDEDTLVPVERLIPDLPPALSEAVRAGMALKRRDRLQTVDALRQLLLEAAAAPPVHPLEVVPARIQLRQPEAVGSVRSGTAGDTSALPTLREPILAVRAPQTQTVAALKPGSPRFPVRKSKRPWWHFRAPLMWTLVTAVGIALLAAGWGRLRAISEASELSRPPAEKIASISPRLPAFQPSRKSKPSPESDRETGLRFVWIPPGKNLVGCSEGDRYCSGNEKPAHDVSFDEGFWMSANEVTVRSYTKFATETFRLRSDRMESIYKLPALPTFPIVSVTKQDAQDFCVWSGGRLPSEAEWEYAARGGFTNDPYPWGTKIPDCNDPWNPRGLARFRGCTGPLGSTGDFSRNTYGLYDMAGNVWEWCADPWHGSYAGAPTDGSTWLSAGEKDWGAVRGGAWDTPAVSLRVSTRLRVADSTRSKSIGFRCVRDYARRNR